jgi:hypothetical protein
MSPPFVLSALLLAVAARESAANEAPPPNAHARCGKASTPPVEPASPWGVRAKARRPAR